MCRLPVRVAVFAVLCLTLSAPAFRANAGARDLIALIRDSRWAEAKAEAARAADPLVTKLVTYYRMMEPGDATESEIDRFMTENPDWPLQGTLERRREEAIVADRNDADVGTACAARLPEGAAALTRCAEAALAPGEPGRGGDYAARAWVALPGDAAAERRFLARFGWAAGPAEQTSRFDRLAWSDTASAARQADRLQPPERAAAQARLALRRDDRGAEALVRALPPAERDAPALVLELARHLRRTNKDADALGVWLRQGEAAERAAPPDRLASFGDERSLLARNLLRDGDARGAYGLMAGHAQTGAEQVANAEFLAGFIALRKLDDPLRAAKHFARLAAVSKSAITQARAHYWLARAETDPTMARVQYSLAAEYPNTFYGQLASLALGEGTAGLAHRIETASDPGWSATQALGFAQQDLVRAATYLVAWGDPERAQAFLLRQAEMSPDPAQRSMGAHLALGFGLPDVAVGIARKAGRDGAVLLDAGWPIAAEVPDDTGLEPSLALAIIRQETSFDHTTVSGPGARGLMQLMPETASLMARKLGLGRKLPDLTTDNALNVRLGSAYLHSLIDDFRGCIPVAVAAYNAGPTKVVEWLSTNGDPRGGTVDMIDWIEEITFGETRNYVQRVIENDVIYRAKQGETLAHPLAPWLG
jgi:soluble lytic murein transglycosylase